MKRSLAIIAALAVVALGVWAYGVYIQLPDPRPDITDLRVTEVYDGDTIQVTGSGGIDETVRLLGIDAPEADTCDGIYATEAARITLLNRMVTLYFDDTQPTTDVYDRVLAYVHIDKSSVSVNRQLLTSGEALVYVHDELFERHSAFDGSERAAQLLGVGLWSNRCL